MQQFEKASEINQIDVGNEASAFVEVLVGKSSAKEDDYQVCRCTAYVVLLYCCAINLLQFFRPLSIQVTSDANKILFVEFLSLSFSVSGDTMLVA